MPGLLGGVGELICRFAKRGRHYGHGLPMVYEVAATAEEGILREVGFGVVVADQLVRGLDRLRILRSRAGREPA